MFFDKKLHESGIFHVKDIIKQNGSFKSFSELCNDFNCSESSYLTYMYFAILSAINKNWKEILKGHDEVNFDFNAPLS